MHNIAQHWKTRRVQENTKMLIGSGEDQRNLGRRNWQSEISATL